MQNKNEQNRLLYPVLDFIDQQYQRQIDPAELAALSFCSYRNLQRIFKSLYGETIGAYQKRIRLEQSAKLLHYTNLSITEIAEEIGYADLQAFRKAFKKQFGQPPSKIRTHLVGLLEGLKTIKEIPSTAIEQLAAKSVYLPPIQVVYHTYVGAYDTALLNAAWAQFFEACNEITLAQNKPLNSYGVVYDDPDITKNNDCRYKLCLAAVPNLMLEETVIPIGQQTIGAHQYMRFLHEGSYESINRTYDVIFGGWLLQNECNFLEHPIIEHYYHNEQHTEREEEYQTFIYIPI